MKNKKTVIDKWEVGTQIIWEDSELCYFLRPNEGRHDDCVESPVGHYISSNEDPKKACLRELKEETNLEGQITGLVGVYPRKTKVSGSLIVIGYTVSIIKEDIFVNRELSEAKFFSRKDLPHVPFLVHRKIIEKSFEDFAKKRYVKQMCVK